MSFLFWFLDNVPNPKTGVSFGMDFIHLRFSEHGCPQLLVGSNSWVVWVSTPEIIVNVPKANSFA